MHSMSSTLKVYTLSLLSFLVGTSEYIIAGILDKIAEAIGVSVVTAGQLITGFSLAYAFGTPILMALTVRMERRKLLLLALGGFVVGNALAFALQGYELLMLSRIAMGVSAGAVVVSALTIAAKVARSGKEGSALASVLMGFTASLIFGVPIGRVVASAYDWTAVFGGIAAIGLLAIAIVALVIPRVDGEAPVPLRDQLALLKQPKMTIALAVTFFWIAGYSVFYSYISPLLLQVSGMSDGTLSMTLFALGLASLVGSLSGGFATDRWGMYRTLYRGLAATGIALVLVAVTLQSPALLAPMLMLWSVAVWSLGPPQQLHLIALAPESSGMMLSLNNSTVQLAMAAGAGIGGAFVERVSLPSVVWAGAASTALAIVAVFLVRKLAESTRTGARTGAKPVRQSGSA